MIKNKYIDSSCRHTCIYFMQVLAAKAALFSVVVVVLS